LNQTGAKFDLQRSNRNSWETWYLTSCSLTKLAHKKYSLLNLALCRYDKNF